MTCLRLVDICYAQMIVDVLILLMNCSIAVLKSP